MLASALKEQHSFIETQLAKFEFEERLHTIRTKVTKNSTAIKKLKEDPQSVSHPLEQDGRIFPKIEANIVELEDRSRRDNIRIISLPDKIESGDTSDFVSSSLPKCFPTLASERLEVMRAHRIGPGCSTGRLLMLICKDATVHGSRSRILKPAKVNGREIRFATDHSNYTI